jgi:four helix bundle protein
MHSIQNFEDLKVWRDALEFSHSIYRESQHGEFARDFALRDQIRRAAISIVSNIAEGFESRTDRLFLEFLGRAKASAGEVRAQLYLAARENYFGDSTKKRLVREATSISRQIAGLMKYLDRSSPPRRKPLARSQ